MFKAILVNASNPKQAVPVVVVKANNWKEALRAAEKNNEGCIAVEAERITPVYA